MRILFISGSMSNGGVERVISVLANRFAKEHEIEIMTVADDKYDYDLDVSIKKHYIMVSTMIVGIRGMHRIIKMRKCIKKINPDVIISFSAHINSIAILSQLFTRYKIIVAERNDPSNDPVTKFARCLRNMLYLFVDGVVFQTQDQQAYFSKVIREKGIIIFNPLKEKLPDIYTGQRDKIIVTVARLEKQKNLKMLIDAFSLLRHDYPEYGLKIYGEGSQRKEFENYILNLGLKNVVSMPGFSRNIHEEIKKSTIFALSSDYEGISNAMLEALAMGIPVVSTDHPIGGAKLFIDNNSNGLLVELGDSNSMYLGMKKLIESPNIFSRAAKKACSLRTQLNIETIYMEWQNFIEGIKK